MNRGGTKQFTDFHLRENRQLLSLMKLNEGVMGERSVSMIPVLHDSQAVSCLLSLITLYYNLCHLYTHHFLCLSNNFGPTDTLLQISSLTIRQYLLTELLGDSV